MIVRHFESSDYHQVAEIYRQGIAGGLATFQTDVPVWEDWNAAHLTVCRLAAFENEIMAGWAALTPVSGRCVYAGVAEVSVYIHQDFRGRGLGKLVLNALVSESEKAGIWTLQSGIFPENTASIGLHQSCGFRMVGYRERIGKKDGQWKDTVLMERRSDTVGI